MDRDESTVGYWVKKHGLQAVNMSKHAARGGLARELLSELIGEGLSLSKIALRTGFSETAVKYWLEKYDLRTRRAVRKADGREAKEAGVARVVMDCHRHGPTEFWLEGRGAYRCLRCRSERVSRRRRKVKEILVEEAGGACAICGYEKFAGALHFHHLDPATKAFAVGHLGATRALALLRAEARKCVLLCSNCHTEVEGGIATVPA